MKPGKKNKKHWIKKKACWLLISVCFCDSFFRSLFVASCWKVICARSCWLSYSHAVLWSIQEHLRSQTDEDQVTESEICTVTAIGLSPAERKPAAGPRHLSCEGEQGSGSPVSQVSTSASVCTAQQPDTVYALLLFSLSFVCEEVASIFVNGCE